MPYAPEASLSRPDAEGPIRADVGHYLAMGWEWRIITRVVNRAWGTAYSARELRELCGEPEP